MLNIIEIYHTQQKITYTGMQIKVHITRKRNNHIFMDQNNVFFYRVFNKMKPSQIEIIGF